MSISLLNKLILYSTLAPPPSPPLEARTATGTDRPNYSLLLGYFRTDRQRLYRHVQQLQAVHDCVLPVSKNSYLQC